MKSIIFYATFGLVFGFCLGHTMGSFKKRYSQSPKDVAQACHIVDHEDTDGFKYWSCEKNK